MDFLQAMPNMHNEVLFNREMLHQILADLSSRLLATFGSTVRLITHGGAVMLLHPQLLGSRQSTRDVDIIKRSMVAEWRARGVYDADSRLTACIKQTAIVFRLGQDWMNADADVALPMAKDPQGRTYDPIATASLDTANLALHTIYNSPGLVLIAVPPFWAVALKLVRYKKHDPADVAALLRSGTRMNGVRWSREVLEGWLLNECWAMGYASYPSWLVADTRERIKHAVGLVENDPVPAAPPLFPSSSSTGRNIPEPQPFGSTRVPFAPLEEHTLVPPPAHVTTNWSHERAAAMAEFSSDHPSWGREILPPPPPPRSPTPPPKLIQDMTPPGPPANSHIHDMTPRSRSAHPQHPILSRQHPLSMSMPLISIPQATQVNRHLAISSKSPPPFGSGSSISMPFESQSSRQGELAQTGSLLLAPDDSRSGTSPPHLLGGQRNPTPQFAFGMHASQLTQEVAATSSSTQYPFDSRSDTVIPPLQRPRATTLRPWKPAYAGGSNSSSPTSDSPSGTRGPFSSAPQPQPPPQFSLPPSQSAGQPPLGRPAHIQHIIQSRSQQFHAHPNASQLTQFPHRTSHSVSHPLHMPLSTAGRHSQHHLMLAQPQRRSQTPPLRRTAFARGSDEDEDNEPVIPIEFASENTSRGGWSGLLPRVGIRV